MASDTVFHVDGRPVAQIWSVGDFEIEIAQVTEGWFDKSAGVFRGVTGTGWLRLPCARPPVYLPGLVGAVDISRLSHEVEVVNEVRHPQTEISLADARRLRSDVAPGETISLDLSVGRHDLQRIVNIGRG